MAEGPSLVTDLPLWPDCPWRDQLAPRYEIRRGEHEGVDTVAVRDPEADCFVDAPAYAWTPKTLEAAMENLCGVSFVYRHGADAVLEALRVRAVTPAARSPEACQLLASYDRAYDWRANESRAEGPDSPA